MSDYLLINIIIASFPLLLSFESKIQYYRKYKYLFPALLVNAVIFILIDAGAVAADIWRFDGEGTYGIFFLGMPVEEILFFITAPYSTLFLFETLNYYVKDKEIALNWYVVIVASGMLLTATFIFPDKIYTVIIIILAVAFIISTALWYPALLRSRNYWIFTLASFVPFAITNYTLISLGVYEYNPAYISGIKLVVIPIEDFVFSYLMLSMALLLYNIFKEKTR